MNTAELLDRIPPSDFDSERGVLGAVLDRPARLDDLDLSPADFYGESNRKVYEAMLALRDKRQGIDPLTVLKELAAAGCAELCGGAAGILQIRDAATVHTSYHAEIIREKSKYRGIIHAATDALRDAYACHGKADEVLETLERELAGIRSGDHAEAVVTAQAAAVEAMCRIDALAERKQHAGLFTGFEQFDCDIGGLFPGELVILAARLGIGKTALACQIADHNASMGRLTYFASLEMEAADLALRIICGLAGVDSKAIRTGKLTQEQYRGLSAAADVFAKRGLLMDQRPGLKVSEIRRTARRLVKQGLSLIVVDYLQFVTPTDPKQSDWQQVGTIARELKSLARELKVPVLALSQLNRESEKEGAKGARHLAGSDIIGRTADMVFILDVKEPENQKDEPWEAWWKIVKNRNGQRGKIQLDWTPSLTRFACHQSIPEEHENYEPAFAGYAGEASF